MTRSASSHQKASYKLPREGTKIRMIYDLLYEHRGGRVPIKEWNLLREQIGYFKVAHCLNQELRDYYGCDILSQRSPAQGPALVGEWVGKVYIDYTQKEEETK